MAVAAVLALGAGACTSSDPSDAGASPQDTQVSSAEADTRPEGPAALIGDPLTGGRGMSLVSAGESEESPLAGDNVVEYPAAGTAVSYSATELPADGMWDLAGGGSADYNTRIVVRLPEDSEDFNGTVVLEWLNVSSGADAAPDLTYLADEVDRGGYVWVGVSAQHIGVEGGPIAVEAPGTELTGAGQGIAALDPDRYGDLEHPGDAYSYDIYTQVARALREPGDDNPLGELEVERVLAVGESQSGYALTTYANGVQPITEAFDGFLIHSRGGAAAPLGEPDAGIDIAATVGGESTRIREDLAVPVVVVETETDVLGFLNYFPARQPDSDNFRLWEIAGTAHADRYQLGPAEELLGCPQPINRGQQSFVLRAALRGLDEWASGGDSLPKADRLNVDASEESFETDEVGNVTGGIRTPAVEAATDVLSGEAPPDASVICLLMGSTTEIPDTILSKRFADAEDYLNQYTEAADEAIRAGFVLTDDREDLLADASPERFET